MTAPEGAITTPDGTASAAISCAVDAIVPTLLEDYYSVRR